MPQLHLATRRRAPWPRAVLLCAAALLAGAAPGLATEAGPRSVVVMRPTTLTPTGGGPAVPLAPGRCLDLVQAGAPMVVLEAGAKGRSVAGAIVQGPRRVRGVEVVLFAPRSGPGPWWVPAKLVRPGGDGLKPGSPARVPVRLLGRVDPEALAVLPGPARAHYSRLARLRRCHLPPAVVKRLMRGLIKEGDSLWHVEMAWGLPQRSFMVNLLDDEQHFIYLKRGPRPIILRFKAGMLVPPLPATGTAP